jgi:hypothetical protein
MTPPAAPLSRPRYLHSKSSQTVRRPSLCQAARRLDLDRVGIGEVNGSKPSVAGNKVSRWGGSGRAEAAGVGDESYDALVSSTSCAIEATRSVTTV